MEDKQAKGFNPSAIFVVPLPGGEVKFEVRFPTDAEWCEWARRHTVIRRRIGRDAWESNPSPAGADYDFDLLRSLASTNGATSLFDSADAAYVLSRLRRFDVEEIARIAGGFRLVARVPGATVSHELRIPRQSELLEYQRASLRVIDRTKAQELKTFLEPSRDLYQAIQKSHEGYAGPVPIVHMDAAVSAVLEELNAAAGEESDPEVLGPGIGTGPRASET